MTETTAPTLIHEVEFPDGDRATITTTTPGHYSLTGIINGEPIALRITAWNGGRGIKVAGVQPLKELSAQRYRAVVVPLWQYLTTAELGTTRPAPLEDRSPDPASDAATVDQPACIPGRETPTAERSLCPTWCEDQDEADHWDRIGKVWQTIHVRRFGPAAVLVPQELHDDGENWMGRCEVTLTHGSSLVLEGESVYTTAAAAETAGHLSAAARWADAMDLIVAKHAAAGRVTINPDHPGAGK